MEPAGVPMDVVEVSDSESGAASFESLRCDVMADEGQGGRCASPFPSFPDLVQSG